VPATTHAAIDDSLPSGSQWLVARGDSQPSHGSLFRMFFVAGFFLFIVLSWDLFGDELWMNRCSFSLGLAL